MEGGEEQGANRRKEITVKITKKENKAVHFQ
jgi:hypothetical protein